MIDVAFQGELGAFSEEAARRYFADAVEAVPRRTFLEVGHAVAEGDVDYGLLPIENTLAGSVVGSYDVLADPDLTVIGEVVTPIHHCLLGLEDSLIEDLRTVLSHPVALAQCQRFFQTHPHLEPTAFYDTAGAAREVATRKDPGVAAIAGEPAAERYGLEVLQADIEDRHDNQTRFLVVARSDAEPEHLSPPSRAPGETMKTALLFETKNVPGALVRVLLPFSERELNLTKIESRPGAVPWSYRFFVELEADAHEPETAAAIEEAREFTSLLRVLGSYRRWSPLPG